MEKIGIEKAEAGMILSKSIFDVNGGILFDEGTKLTGENISTLKLLGFSHIHIYSNISTKLEISNEVIDMIRTEAKAAIKELIDRYFTSNRQDSDRIKNIINDIIEQIIANRDVVAILHELKHHDDYTYRHSINVCIYSVATAMMLGYDEEELKEIGMGAILHDIGKLQIPKYILGKGGPLTIEEFNEIKTHTVLGYEMLKNWEYNKISTADIALMHHERCDGTGYPNRLKFNQVLESVRIVMVADVYDALTSDRAYRQKQSPDAVMSYINDLGMHQFDRSIVSSFKKCISIYPVGTGIVLNTMEKGIVLKVNMDMPTRPVIRIIVDSDGKKIEDYQEIDLAAKWDVFIVDSYDL